MFICVCIDICMYKHTCLHTHVFTQAPIWWMYTNMYTHTYWHSRTVSNLMGTFYPHTHVHAHTYLSDLIYTQVPIYRAFRILYMYTYTYVNKQMHTYVYTQMLIHTCIHAHMLTHTNQSDSYIHTIIHPHIHTQVRIWCAYIQMHTYTWFLFVVHTGTNLMGRRIRVDYAVQKEKGILSPRSDGFSNNGAELHSKSTTRI